MAAVYKADTFNSGVSRSKKVNHILCLIKPNAVSKIWAVWAEVKVNLAHSVRNPDAWKAVESGEGWEPGVSYERCSVQETETVSKGQRGGEE